MTTKSYITNCLNYMTGCWHLKITPSNSLLQLLDIFKRSTIGFRRSFQVSKLISKGGPNEWCCNSSLFLPKRSNWSKRLKQGKWNMNFFPTLGKGFMTW
ncbi:hypothetical protein RHMOL_Rhmol01G0178500 [Rhododendron molle]|nr:hypothetical protein RHMOL_Rhmol01G0178500 [Rhododendron molle]